MPSCPHPPPGYCRVSLSQLVAADQELFRIVGQKCQNRLGAIPPSTITNYEKEFKEAMFSLNVRLHLSPLQGSSGTASSSTSRNAPQPTPSPEAASVALSRAMHRIDNLEKQINNLKRNTPSKNTNKGGGKGKKGSDSKRPRGPSMPAELHGMNDKTADSQPICFNHNMGGCNLAPPGGRCPRGMHVCCKPGCIATHGFRGNH